METMTKEEAMKYCRYYGKENAPHINVTKNNVKKFASCEEMWVGLVEKDWGLEHLRKKVEYYLSFGLADFSADDDVPISLKAVIFYRATYWNEGGKDEVADDFKAFYKECYLNFATK